MKARILITGATGFIGRSLFPYLLARGYEVAGLDAEPCIPSGAHIEASCLEVDIRKPFKIHSHFDIVIHLAALNRTDREGAGTYDSFRQANVDGLRNTICACDFDRFLLFSTASMYAKNGNPSDESGPVEPVSFYEKSKREAELAASGLIEAGALTIFRPVNVVGPGQSARAAVPAFFEKAMKAEPIEIYVPCNRRIQMVSLRDINEAVLRVVEDRAIAGLYNIAGTESTEVASLARAIKKIANSNSEIILENKMEEIFSPVLAEKASSSFGWGAKDGIASIIYDYARAVLGKNANLEGAVL